VNKIPRLRDRVDSLTRFEAKAGVYLAGMDEVELTSLANIVRRLTGSDLRLREDARRQAHQLQRLAVALGEAAKETLDALDMTPDEA
jgi:hypothetical protein